MERFSSFIGSGRSYLQSHWRLLALVVATVAALPPLIIAISYLVIAPNGRHVIDMGGSDIDKSVGTVGIVLGAGVTKDGKPYKELRGRLDTAADALERGYVDKLILSGDNRFKDYDEPTAMKNYLIQERGVPADRLQEDFAGRSTYETCERAAKVFKLDRVVLISAGSHLPRAIFLCRHFGIESFGIASGVEANNATRREALARVKALYNTYVRGEKTILGAPISF